jgi:hypothetical protein
MKIETLRFVASWLLTGFMFVALSMLSFADDKKDVAKNVKFACSQHGPKNMMLTLSLEKGDTRKIEITGKNTGAKWFITINGKPAQDGNGGKNGDTIKVHSGDKITWRITGARHGVAFAEKDLAQAMLDFDTEAGKPLEDLTDFLSTAVWKAFGSNRWGTKPIDAAKDPVVMVSCTVKK